MHSRNNITHKNSKSCLQSEAILQFDQFGTPMMFNYYKGSATYRSPLGSCLSIFILLLTLGFTIQ